MYKNTFYIFQNLYSLYYTLFPPPKKKRVGIFVALMISKFIRDHYPVQMLKSIPVS